MALLLVLPGGAAAKGNAAAAVCAVCAAVGAAAAAAGMRLLRSWTTASTLPSSSSTGATSVDMVRYPVLIANSLSSENLWRMFLGVCECYVCVGVSVCACVGVHA